MGRWGVTIAVACLGIACPGEDGSDDSEWVEPASVDFALMASTFAGGSARICGTRPPVSAALNCDVALPFDPAPGEPAEPPRPCACWNFNADGVLVDAMGNRATASGLCPSTAAPAADWTFSYALYTGPGCTGTQLNDAMNGFVCHDANDIASRAHPNQSIDRLTPGLNVNHILCLNPTATKSWSFASCTEISSVDDSTRGISLFDCDCTRTDRGVCSCGASGLTQADLEPGCGFDAECNIRCAPPMQ